MLTEVYIYSVTQIKVGKHEAGIVGLNEVLKIMAQMSLQMPGKEIASEMIKGLSKKLSAKDKWGKINNRIVK